MAADIGTLARLPKVVSSSSWVKDVCLSARNFGAAEALAVGFVSQVHESKVEALGAALKLAKTIASKSPIAVQGTKELLNHARDHTVEESKDFFLSALFSLQANLSRPKIHGCLEWRCSPGTRHGERLAFWLAKDEAKI